MEVLPGFTGDSVIEEDGQVQGVVTGGGAVAVVAGVEAHKLEADAGPSKNVMVSRSFNMSKLSMP